MKTLCNWRLVNKFYMLCCIVFCVNAYGQLPPNTKFCIPKQYTITYRCADGTNAAEPVTLGYGQTYVTPDALTACSGGVTQWWVDGTQQYITQNTTLPYTYTHDITLVTGLDANIEGTSFGYDKENMTWFVKFPYGTVSGVSRCSKYPVAFENVYNGPNSEPTDNRGEDGAIYCYCKMTAPNRPGAAWVNRYIYETASKCSDGCCDLCGANIRKSLFYRQLIFTATVQ